MNAPFQAAQAERGPANEPLVSVILPVYNGESLIADTLDSALRQTYRNIEIIAIDDGSTDRTLSILESYAARDPRVHVVRQENGGVAHARNRGLSEARGEFIAPLDADDLWEPAKIERQMERMREAGEETGLVYCWWVWIDGKGAVMDRSPSWRVEGDGLQTLLKVNYTGNASIPLYRRRCLEEVGGYDEELAAKGGQGCEDWDLALRVAARFPVAVVPALLVGYRRRPNSMSTSLNEMWRSHLLVAHGLEGREPGVPATVLQWSERQFALYLAGVAFWSGAYFQACLWALRAGPSGLLFRVLPYALKVILRRLRIGGPRHPQIMTPGQALDADRVPGALVPYDRIYGGQAGPDRALMSHPDKGRAIRDRVAAILRCCGIQVGVLIAMFAAVAALHARNDGLWFQGDAPRHAANGLFWGDLIQAHPSAPVDFAVRYYARYPVVAPASYPPFFYLIEALAFRVFSPSPYVARFVVLAFSILAGIYTMAWARRWVAPWAGWAGAFVALTPGVVLWTNGVMLNIPAMALSLALLYHFRRWLEGDGRRQIVLSAILFITLALTYYASVTMLAVCVVWYFVARKSFLNAKATLWALAGVVALALIPMAISAGLAPIFLERHLPVPALLANAAYWTYYFEALPQLAGTAVLLLALAGLGIGLKTVRWRNEAAYLSTWILVLILMHSLLPARDARYILPVAPALVLSVAVLFASIPGSFIERHPRWASVLLAAGLAVGLWSASRVAVPEVSGFREIAAFFEDHGARDTVLYDGYHDGVFSFYVRVSDPKFDRRVVLGDRLLYYNGPTNSFQWVETSRVQSTGDIVQILRAECGCRWIALERGVKSEWSRPQQLLRAAAAGPDFEFVRSFPVQGAEAERVDVYRLREPVTPVATVDLTFPSYNHTAFTKVAPITR